MGSNRITLAREQAETMLTHVRPDEIAALAGHRDPSQRLLALSLMQADITAGTPAIRYLGLARPLVEDPDNDCRWQALIVIGELMWTHPEEVWQVVLAHGGSEDSDMRAGVATVLLEHLLEEHFEEYFPRIRAEILRGSARFAETVGMCWFDRFEGWRYRRVQKLLRNAARGGSKRA
jgi:hypothetical protein